MARATCSSEEEEEEHEVKLRQGMKRKRLTNGNLILDSSRNDDVGYLSLWLNVALEVWFDEGKPLLDAAFDVTSSFGDVSKQSSRQAGVGVGFAKDLVGVSVCFFSCDPLLASPNYHPTTASHSHT